MSHSQPEADNLSIVIKVTMVPVIDMGEFRHILSLPLPTKSNTYGFRWYHPDAFMYSPIDLTVAVMEWQHRSFCERIKDLKKFFDTNLVRFAESKVKIGVSNNNNILEIDSISNFKLVLSYLKSPIGQSAHPGHYEVMRKTLKRNAPLTFWKE